jgi:hypothetical protein
MIYKTIDEWIEHNPNHRGLLPIEVCHQIWGTKDNEKPYRLLGEWTYQDKCDIEDCVDMWRFEKIDDGIYVKHKRKENA